MKKAILFAALAATFAGCLSITVEDYGYEVVKDSAGTPLVDKEGKVQTIHKGQRWSYFKHWIEQMCEEFSFSRKPGDQIDFAAKNYKDQVSPELNKLVETSFKGAAELAAKIGAAIATAGGSAGVEGVAAMVRQFVQRGGDVSKATVSCANGACTITDGSVSESCTSCFDCEAK